MTQSNHTVAKPARRTLFETSVGRLLGLNKLVAIDANLMATGKTQAADYLAGGFAAIDVQYTCSNDDLERIPTTGPLVIVVNHPLGAIDGMLIADLTLKARDDVRIIANYFLTKLKPLAKYFLAVDPFGGKGASGRSLKALREALNWVKAGHCLVIFPSGKVAHRSWRRFAVTEAEWLTTTSKIVQNTGANVLPIYIEGRNSWLFHLVGLINRKLRTILLPRETLNKRGQTIAATVGHMIPSDNLKRYTQPEQLAEFLRLKTLRVNPQADRRYLYHAFKKLRQSNDAS